MDVKMNLEMDLTLTQHWKKTIPNLATVKRWPYTSDSSSQRGGSTGTNSTKISPAGALPGRQNRAPTSGESNNL